MDTTQYLKITATKMFYFLTADIKAMLTPFIVAIGAYFAGLHNFIVPIGLLVMIDTLTGTWASVIVKGEKFTSKFYKGLLQKFLLYSLLMLTTIALQKAFHLPFEVEWLSWLTFPSIMGGCIVSYETVSIFENARVINPNLKFLKALSKLIEVLQKRRLDTAMKLAEGKETPKEITKETPN